MMSWNVDGTMLWPVVPYLGVCMYNLSGFLGLHFFQCFMSGCGLFCVNNVAIVAHFFLQSVLLSHARRNAIQGNPQRPHIITN
jgi:hypothetical protein